MEPQRKETGDQETVRDFKRSEERVSYVKGMCIGECIHVGNNACIVSDFLEQ